jgi:XTP/dITP diphosphohydrolase
MSDVDRRRALLVATGNRGKLVEFRELLDTLGLELLTLQDVGLSPPEETGTTFGENARQKATAAARESGLWTLADDSGLCVAALGGAPGVRSARYAATDEERRAKLLREIAGAADRSAHFFCAAALCGPGGEPLHTSEGRVDGDIAAAARGTNGFGYDPIFLPRETPGRTLAELSSAEKNRLSHRGRAVAKLRPALERLVQGSRIR